MEWFCLTEEQVLLSPNVELPNLEMLCNIKLDVVLNIRRSVNPNYDKDIKDEISKSCKEFKTKQMFEEYLSAIDEQENAKDSEDKAEMAKKLQEFDMMMDKNLATVSSKKILKTRGSESIVNSVDSPNILKILQKS